MCKGPEQGCVWCTKQGGQYGRELKVENNRSWPGNGMGTHGVGCGRPFQELWLLL